MVWVSYGGGCSWTSIVDSGNGGIKIEVRIASATLAPAHDLYLPCVKGLEPFSPNLHPRMLPTLLVRRGGMMKGWPTCSAAHCFHAGLAT